MGNPAACHSIQPGRRILKPSRELDALIAEKVMGWVKVERQEQLEGKTWNGKPFTIEQFHNICSMDIAWLVNGELSLHEQPHCSTDISAAWEVVSKLQTQFNLIRIDRNEMKNLWTVIVSDEAMEKTTLAYGDTAPHAICLAALKAVGVNVD